ncbi:putative Ig domain-containing protein [Streptococcus sp. VEG1o]|uniref:putative Ig domain-containing protein n=1 Tax=Streptococcus sp. VEG1o TaxID=3097368 RepID=UPI00397DEF6C
MKKNKRNKFDWYGLNQRFSIRTYHFGAASVLLGAVITLGLTSNVSADEVEANSSTPAVTEVVKVEEAATAEAGKTDGTDLTAVKGLALEALKELTALSDVEKATFEKDIEVATTSDSVNEIIERAKGINENAKVATESKAKEEAVQPDLSAAKENAVATLDSYTHISEEAKADFVAQIKAADTQDAIGAILNEANKAEKRAVIFPNQGQPISEGTSFRSLGTSDTEKTKNYTFQDAMTIFPDLTKMTGNNIDFQVAYYLAGANSGDNWKFRLQLDEAIASKVETITVKPVGSSNNVVLTRVGDTNIFQSNFIRANGGIFGGAELGTQLTTGRITLKEPIQNIVKDPNIPEFMAYRTYVFDTAKNSVVATSATSGVFRVRENQTPSPTSTDSKKLDKLKKITTSAGVKYNPSYRTYGAIVFDQTMLKNGTMALTLQDALKNTTYNLDIDPALLPYIANVELHIAEYSFSNGLDEAIKTEHYRATTTFDGNGHATFAIGSNAVSLGNSSNKNSYVNVNGAQNPAYVRTVIKFKQPIRELITGSSEGYPVFKVPADSDILPITGYFTAGDGGVLPTTIGNSGLLATDVDLPDKDIYDPETEVINKPFGEATTADDLSNAVKKIPSASKVVAKAGATVPDGNTAGTFEVPVVITYPDGSSEEVTVTVIVAESTQKPTIGNIENKTVIEKKPIEPIDVPVENKPNNGTVEVTGLPTGLTYDPTTGKITGTPTVSDWGNTEEERDFSVKVVVKDAAGNPVAEKDVTIKVQRDTDSDGIPDVTDPDDDNDGYTDDQEKAAGTDSKDPNSKPAAPAVGNLENKTVIEKKPIEPIDVPVENKPNNGSVEVTGLPTGLSYDPATGKITGTPTVSDWGNTEEERDFPVKVVVKDAAGNPVAEKDVTIKVQRDTDSDGIPDVTDPDDDNDGYTDDQEKAAGTDSKDPNSKPATPAVGNLENKTVIEKKPIEPIDVPVENKPNNGTVEVTGLPTGLSYDPATGKITGTPTVSDWGNTEEERDFPVKVVVKDAAGNPVAEKDVTIKVQRDTDSDGIPDVTDPDDDNDGYTDEQEKAAGTDSKDPNSKPTASVGNLENKTVIEKQPIEPIDVPVENKPNNGSVEVTGLPTGLTYDPATGKITGTPTVSDWGKDEEERDFPVKVVVKDAAGNPVAEKDVTIKVQRDTDSDGIPDVTDPDDDNDGYTDEQEKAAGTDSKDPNSKPTASVGNLENKTVIEKQPIEPIDVPVENKPNNGSVEVTGLPTGLTYDPATGKITGTPTVSDWGKDEEERDFPVKVVVKDAAGNPVAEKDVTIKVQRDTDSDGIPDVTDPDDDNDGYTDEQEKAAGTDSKDPNSKPTASVGNLENKTVIEKQPIEPIDVPVENKPNNGSVEVTGLPTGLTYDPATGKITGTPTVTDWGKDEEERDFPVKVVVKDANGNPVAEKDVTIKVQRDTDGDKLPDVTDPDDDNDGYTDDQEKTAGTDSKDPNSKPIATVGDIDNKTVVEKQPIEPIEVPVTNVPHNGSVEVTGLPTGLTYDPATGKITGTPTVTDWGKDEEERDFPVKVVVKDANGNPVAEKDITIKVQRDTDGDKLPDVTDPDDDNDGYTDDQEKTAGTDSKDPNSKPIATVGDIDNKTVVEKQPIEPIEVPVTNVPHNGSVEVTGLPDGLTYDPATGKITGTPTVTDWGKDEEERDFPVKVVVKDAAGNPVAEKDITIKVQRDTDSDGIPDVTDSDDDNDGYTDEQEKAAGTDSKDPNSKPIATVGDIDNKTVVEKQPIEPIEVPVTNVPHNGSVEVTGLPDGLTYDPATGKITGTPTVTDWGKDEEERDFPVKVVVKDAAGNPVAEKDITIKVQRDTDSDGIPDVTDSDDDNDGYTDEQEKAAGTDSKDPNSKPIATVGDIDNKTVVEKQPIEPIEVPVTNVPHNGSVEVTGLPDGLTYDPATGKITGTPTVTDWGKDEEERDFPVKVVVKDAAGNPVAEKDITIKVQRDTDSDGIPDVTDSDDDNDGYTDEQEKAAGTDSKDPNSKPIATVGDIDNKTVVEKQPIEPIEVPVTNVPHNGSVEVTGLPDGLTYDPATGKITGTPTVTDWGKDEEERDFPVKVVVKDAAGNPVAEKDITIKVQRDTDGDKLPDVTDPDDDNDGYTDEQEKAAGTDSKDPNSKPIATVGEIGDKTVIEKQPIEPINIPVSNVPKGGNVYVAGLPDGLTYDPATGKITGTPTVTNWGKDEEEINFLITVFISDADGKTIAEKDFVIKVQRDTDSDGIPDVTDSDDDNDGYTDEQEKAAGTDSKDPNSKPLAATVKATSKAVLPKTGTESSNLGAYGLAALGLVGLMALGKGKKEEE